MITALVALGVLTRSNSGGGGLEVTYGPVVALADRTVSISRLTVTPPTWPATFDPSDNAPLVIDLSDFLAYSALDTLIDVTVSPLAANLGIAIDTDTRKPRVDRDESRIALWFKVSDQFHSASAFKFGVPTVVTCLFNTASDPTETYERSAILIVRRL